MDNGIRRPRCFEETADLRSVALVRIKVVATRAVFLRDVKRYCRFGRTLRGGYYHHKIMVCIEKIHVWYLDGRVLRGRHETAAQVVDPLLLCVCSILSLNSAPNGNKHSHTI